MRRIASTLATVAAAGMLALSLPSAAHAANGVLLLNGELYFDPSGCYPSDRWPLAVRNDTDQVVAIYETPDCTGEVLEFVFPDESSISEFGNSVYVP
ncbi:hypothetical protein HNP84_005479 [Thermocatellispora tengchongensis]|uniref:Secreted protein n=1 Tax=Thermocatellispora tengchongensis TaxID=1073253 RepID=A0A840PI33_9ACTN|nr:hypothetical protein [Thermocatellispora tengchongensis]MBB5135735.1 hypothetical protein [Thermocatellispora tengchongensis]